MKTESESGNKIKLIDNEFIIGILKKEMYEPFKLEITYDTSVFMTNHTFIKSICNIRIVTDKYEILLGYGKLSKSDEYKEYSIAYPKISEFYKSMISMILSYLYDIYYEDYH